MIMNPEGSTIVFDVIDGKTTNTVVLPQMSIVDLTAEITDLGQGGKIVVFPEGDPNAPLSNFTSRK